MPTQNPLWRVKSRPCPFYHNGRCLFSTSCNFLHPDPGRSSSEPPIYSTNIAQRSTPLRTYSPPPQATSHVYPDPIPVDTVQTEDTIPRSHRLSQLLLALQDVIGSDATQDTGDVVEHPSLVANDGGSSHVSEESWTVVPGPVDVLPNTEGQVDVQEQTSHDTATNYAGFEFKGDDRDVFPFPGSGVVPSDVVSSSDGSDAHATELPIDYLSPMSSLPFVPFPDNNHSAESNGSVYAESWTSPFQMSLSPPRSPSVASNYVFFPPGDPGRVSTSSTLPPLPVSRYVDPIAEKTADVYSQSWSDADEDVTAQYLGMTLGTPHTETAAPAPLPPFEVADQQRGSIYSALASMIDLGSDGEIEASEYSPSCSTHTETIPSNDALYSHASIEAWIAEKARAESSPTLAYTTSSTPDNDAVHTLYDVYSNILSPGPDEQDLNSLSFTAGISAVVETTSAATPSLSDILRSSGDVEVVSSGNLPCEDQFSPSPNRGRHNTMASTPSNRSLSSPPPRTVFSGRGSNNSDLEKWEFGSSSKVPFGFRNLANGSSNHQICPLEPRIIVASFASSAKDPQDPAVGELSDVQKPLVGSDHISSRESRESRRTSHLKPLRLSTAFSMNTLASPLSSSKPSSKNRTAFTNRTSISSTVSSALLSSNSYLLSSTRSSYIPRNIRHSIASAKHSHSSSPTSVVDNPLSAPLSHPNSWPFSTRLPHGPSQLNRFATFSRSESRQSEPTIDREGDEVGHHDKRRYDHIIHSAVSEAPRMASVPRPATATALQSNLHAIATPRPTLMFAIASDDVAEVKRVLDSGEARPSDQVGPQSALAFTLTNDKLTHKLGIVKALLAYGADPSTLKNTPPHSSNGSSTDDTDPQPDTQFDALMEILDPATRYYVKRANAAHTRRTSALIHRSFFRPLTRVRYELVGQDCVFEQLFRVLSIHSQKLSVSPIVILLCGPSGHGKSLLASKFGSLLDVPTHTVNMTTLRSTHELWQSYSMDVYEKSPQLTLAEFLLESEGKRCIVVLDEIDKTDGENILWSLLMPWETGRCSVGAGKRPIDVRNVVWLGTSNVGHELVFEHHASQPLRESMSREEYLELMGALRVQVTERLGASLTSRVTAVLPFTPFSLDEKEAICMEALHILAGESMREMTPQAVESIVDRALSEYIPAEGARSLYRVVSSQLMEMSQ